MGCNNMMGTVEWFEGQDSSEVIRELKKELDNVTNLLCQILKAIETNGSHKICEYNVEGLKQWFEQHKEHDKKMAGP